jgi:two-component system nitrogen regulation sensor histidine kinase NtrY
VIQQHNRDQAQRLLEEIDGFDLADPNQRPRLSQALQLALQERDLDLVALYEDTEFIHALLNPRTGSSELPDLSRSFLLEALREDSALDVDEIANREERWLLGAAAALSRDGAPRAVIVTGTVLDAALASKTELLVNAHQAQRQFAVQENEIRTIHLLFLLMVTLILLLVCTWVGLILARRVVEPIEALAEGTRRIMSGDLDHRVPAAADDEIGVLVDSFNRMTDELQSSRQQLQESNSELMHSNRRLGEEQALIRAVLDNVIAGILSVDEKDRVLTCNSAALEMLHLGARPPLGRPLLEVVENRPALLDLFTEILATEDPFRREVRLTLGGEWKTFEVKSAAMTGERTGARVIVIEDLTELIQAQQLATWNEAARRIAHEIKNPLTPIKLAAERLLRKHRQGDPDLGPALERAVEIIVREVGSMKTMVDEFSRFARMPHPRPQEVDLDRMLHETVGLYRDIKPGVEVRVADHERLAPGAAGPISLDREQIRGALINLLDNAVAATDAPGTIEISAERGEGTLTIRVADTGTGIPPEARDKLFLPYFSTKGRGTGLGLAIVHRIVADHHGSIRVEDNLPRGTVFRLEIPQG